VWLGVDAELFNAELKYSDRHGSLEYAQFAMAQTLPCVLPTGLFRLVSDATRADAKGAPTVLFLINGWLHRAKASLNTLPSREAG